MITVTARLPEARVLHFADGCEEDAILALADFLLIARPDEVTVRMDGRVVHGLEGALMALAARRHQA